MQHHVLRCLGGTVGVPAAAAVVSDAALAPDGPHGGTRGIVFGCYVILHELELSLVLARSVEFDKVSMEVSVHLPLTVPTQIELNKTWFSHMR